MARVELGEPEMLTSQHIVAGFTSGSAALDNWLATRALANQVRRASRTFVALHRGEVIGYYALAAGAIAVIEAPSKLRRNMPDPIPIGVLGRLAVSEAMQGQGVGAFLLQRALHRALLGAEHLALAGVLVHALDDRAKDFYLRHGFQVSPIRPLTLAFSFKDVDL